MSEKPAPRAEDQDPDAQADPSAPNGARAQSATGPDTLREAERLRDDYFEQLQRTRAEFLNYQKRSKAQAQADRTYAIVPLALDLIGVLDNFQRAVEAARSAGVPSIVEGLDMVEKQLSSALAKHGIEPIQALGQPFDPNLHAAIAQQVSRDHPEGTVLAEPSKGYRLLDRVLRPASVVVSIHPPKAQNAHSQEEA